MYFQGIKMGKHLMKGLIDVGPRGGDGGEGRWTGLAVVGAEGQALPRGHAYVSLELTCSCLRR